MTLGDGSSRLGAFTKQYRKANVGFLVYVCLYVCMGDSHEVDFREILYRETCL